MTQSTPTAEPDEARLLELGYPQELARGLHLYDNAALGIAAISPVVGLYAVVLVGTIVAGPAWVWVLPIALAGQCLLLAVYSELASEFPIAGGAYQWGRRLMGGTYGWLTGWVAICAYCAANTTIAYLGAPWALTLAGVKPTPNAIVVTGMIFVAVCAIVGALGVDVLRRAIKLGIAAEIVASVGIGLALLLVFRTQDFSVLTHTYGAEVLSGGSVGAGMLAALAVAGWVFIGFDACVSASEETRSAARHVPRAIWIALPQELLTRPKRGFGVPLPIWFRGPLKSFLWDHLRSSSFRERGITSPEFVDLLLEEHDRGRRDNSHWLWMLLMLELWFREQGAMHSACQPEHAY